MKVLGGETGVLVELDLPSVVGGAGAGEDGSRGLIPTPGQLSESEEKHLRLRVKQLICGSLNGMRSPGRSSGWVLEFRDCGAIPGRGLLLTAETWTKGM